MMANKARVRESGEVLKERYKERVLKNIEVTSEHEDNDFT